jgi:hypothetical protein
MIDAVYKDTRSVLEPAGAIALAAANSWLAWRKANGGNGNGAGDDEAVVVAIASGANAALPSLIPSRILKSQMGSVGAALRQSPQVEIEIIDVQYALIHDVALLRCAQHSQQGVAPCILQYADKEGSVFSRGAVLSAGAASGGGDCHCYADGQSLSRT